MRISISSYVFQSIMARTKRAVQRFALSLRHMRRQMEERRIRELDNLPDSTHFGYRGKDYNTIGQVLDYDDMKMKNSIHQTTILFLSHKI